MGRTKKKASVVSGHVCFLVAVSSDKKWAVITRCGRLLGAGGGTRINSSLDLRSA